MPTIQTLFALLAITLSLQSLAETKAKTSNQTELYRVHRVIDNVEGALAFYQGALGFKVLEDRVFSSPKGVDIEEANRWSRLIVLGTADGEEVLGLVNHVKPTREAIDIADAPFKVGTTTLIFAVPEVASTFAKIKEVEGVKILMEPTSFTYPPHNGKPAQNVIMSAVQDPNGFAVEINQYQ